jgi:hypothetical protein
MLSSHSNVSIVSLSSAGIARAATNAGLGSLTVLRTGPDHWPVNRTAWPFPGSNNHPARSAGNGHNG